ncbi:O-antigen ligase family protein [Ulvibacter litoralis]|uniref:O-Antigen ligase n=1 Tax=Ulvibacter litoralis TaxID=227084 RepID=A0A1G7GWK5_9FLAO|nr:O-antigen ligase family protein [Ulvibacter litoralis]GHC59871.1 ligase [Ulvibacter litoralis]SDE92485.1 O-Antigen ligase [Ulvibacter litoralis]
MSKKIKYTQLVAIHIALGIGIYVIPGFAKLILPVIILFFLVLLLSGNNKNDEALMAAAYIMGYEVLSRMTGTSISYEFAKYAVIGFLFIGMFYRGFHRKSWPYIFFIFLLIPGIVLSAINLNYGSNVGNAIGFNLSGPVCLAISALYCYDRKMSFQKFQTILMCIFLPLITMVTYLYFYTPDLRESLRGTGSNFDASGGFGPNQVATILGLAIFILFTRLLTVNNKLVNLIDLGLLGMMTYRAIVTFSRGGVITAIICILFFLFYYYRKIDASKKAKLIPRLLIVVGVLAVTWGVSVFYTSGLIVNRYSNEDAAGQLKEDITTGREILIETELNAFYENPILGIGVGKAKEYREAQTGINLPTHNETSRMLSEHGVFGIAGLLVLLFAPLAFRRNVKTNFFFYSFLAFWFLTINHSSMRIAAPAFIYGLALINIVDFRKMKK